MKYKKDHSVCSVIGFAIIGSLSTKKEHQGHCGLQNNKGWMWKMCVYSVGSFDVHESVHRDMITKVTNNMQLYRLIYYSKSALHVLGDVFAHHQEHLTVFTVSGSILSSRCRLVSWMS